MIGEHSAFISEQVKRCDERGWYLRFVSILPETGDHHWEILQENPDEEYDNTIMALLSIEEVADFLTTPIVYGPGNVIVADYRSAGSDEPQRPNPN